MISRMGAGLRGMTGALGRRETAAVVADRRGHGQAAEAEGAHVPELAAEVTHGGRQGVLGISERVAHLGLEAATHLPELSERPPEAAGGVGELGRTEHEQRDHEEQQELLPDPTS